ncbi:hypothetical protein PGT21_035846 [Puccinia graminis f. sp. tritici]|uniref:Uncharacterized protein n=1 Tax=Puccinia graminis f. sp. tritici TaxID=56615 RepID=A0A5B0QQ61_PUCGR|nr:hypothetical protein PGT21_035846 [Puccinia graminis f. sp. tritici]
MQSLDDFFESPTPSPTESHNTPVRERPPHPGHHPGNKPGHWGNTPEEYRNPQSLPFTNANMSHVGVSIGRGTGPVRGRATPQTYFSPYQRSSPAQPIPQADSPEMDMSWLFGTANLGEPNQSTDPIGRNRRLRGLQRQLGISNEVYAQAEHLFDIPLADRWPAMVLLLLHSTQSGSMFPEPTSVSPEPSDHSHLQLRDQYNSPQLRAFIRNQLGQILLRADLESYGRAGARMSRFISKAPALIIKKFIDDQPESVRVNYLPSDFETSSAATAELMKLIRELLKDEKNAFADAILLGTQTVSPGHHRPMPTLDQLVIHVFREMDLTMSQLSDAQINSHPKMTHKVKVRIAYLRFLLNVHRRQLRNPAGFWELIDKDLEERRRKSPAYKAAFVHLILQKDRKLWNGSHMISDVPAEAQGLPTEPEIIAHLESIQQISGHYLNRPRSS